MDSRSTLDPFARGLFYVLAVELIAGGGGHLIDLGTVSIRMVLFAAAMVVTVVYFLYGRRIPKDYMILTLGLPVILGVGAVIGYMNGSTLGNILEDIKPQLYILLLPFLAFSITNTAVVTKLGNIFRTCALAMAILYIILLILINTGVIPFLDFWNVATSTEEFFFRGEIAFFYKGFIYLCVGLIFLIEGRAKKWQVAIVLLAIVLTVTRGFWVALLLTYGSYRLAFAERNVRQIAIGALLVTSSILIAVYGNTLISSVSKTIDQTRASSIRGDAKPYLLGDRTHSDNERTRQLKQVAERVTPVSAIVGHGLGQGVPIRPVHMEISYLEIFHKQGIVGLTCWLLIFLTGVRRGIAVRHNRASIPFLISFVFVFVLSMFNQFVNNPIGLFIIMVSIVSFDRLENGKQKILDK